MTQSSLPASLLANPAPSQPLPLQAAAASPSKQPQVNLFSYQFDPSDEPGPSTQVPRLPHASSGKYGIVPYLSSTGRTGEETNSSPNLITTSLGTKLLPAEDGSFPSSPLMVRIPMKYTQYKTAPHPILPAPSAAAVGSASASAMSYNISHGKALHTLAKKISMKNKKLSHSLKAGNQPHLSELSKELPRTCPSCGHQNAQHKKRCGACTEFIVGTRCPSCSAMNYFRSKNCGKCGAAMPVEPPPVSRPLQLQLLQLQRTQQLQPQQLQQPQPSTSRDLPPLDRARDRTEVRGSSSSDSSTSPSSPKYSAPPIRSAVLKSMFPQVWGQGSL